MSLYHLPYFLPEPAVTRGVDYLGLRATNLQMMDGLFAGLNNTAGHVRAFSLLAWTIWCYREGQKASGRDYSSEDFGLFREKVETLFIMSHQQADQAAGIPGAQQKNLIGTVRLCFKTFGRRNSNTLLSAINYGPGLKGRDGLGFAVTVDPAGLYVLSDVGEHLAMAFDAWLREHLEPSWYAFLCDRKQDIIDVGDALQFATAWRIDMPSDEEKKVFLAALYRPGLSVAGTSESMRSAAVGLLLTTLASAREALTEDELRRAMATAGGLPLDHAQRLACRRWQVLIVRQAQRLAIEALFGWIERCIWTRDARSVAELCAWMLDAVGAARPGWAIASLLVDRAAAYAGQPSIDAMFEASRDHEEFDLVGRARHLEMLCKNSRRSDEVPAYAIDVLTLCAQYAGLFDTDPEASAIAAEGQAHRMPLGAWRQIWAQATDGDFPEFLEYFLESKLVSQHLAVAAARFNEDSGKLRLGFDDAGIVSLLPSVSKCWIPRLSEDRLHIALSLLNQCGVVHVQMTGRIARYALASPTLM